MESCVKQACATRKRSTFSTNSGIPAGAAGTLVGTSVGLPAEGPCRYRNFLMACACLMAHPLQPMYFPLLDTPTSPSIRNLQAWIEDAWKKGKCESKGCTLNLKPMLALILRWECAMAHSNTAVTCVGWIVVSYQPRSSSSAYGCFVLDVASASNS